MADEPTVNPCADQIPADWLTVFQDMRTALLGHVTDDGFVDEKIRPAYFRGCGYSGPPSPCAWRRATSNRP